MIDQPPVSHWLKLSPTPLTQSFIICFLLFFLFSENAMQCIVYSASKYCSLQSSTWRCKECQHYKCQKYFDFKFNCNVFELHLLVPVGKKGEKKWAQFVLLAANKISSPLWGNEAKKCDFSYSFFLLNFYPETQGAQ